MQGEVNSLGEQAIVKVMSAILGLV